MLRAAVLAAALCTLAGPGQAQGPAEAAAAAQVRLAEAARSLAEAEGARDRIAALTRTVRAYEDGLAALRDGVRRASLREAAIARDLVEGEERVSAMLAALGTVAAAPRPVMMLHPDGPAGTARAAMLMADLAAALDAEAAVLAVRLDEIRRLRAAREDAMAVLAEGLSGAQAAREALSAAVSERSDLPRRFVEDRVAMAVLLAASETLGVFAAGLPGEEAALDGAAPDGADLKGSLALPVAGEVLRRAGEPDAAGITRPGWVVVTEPRALVTAPVAVTLRYAGPLLDYGNVAILEPAPGTLFVLAGLAEIYGSAGEVLPGGAPLGLMGGALPDAQAILTANGEAAGTSGAETLYIEVREGDAPVDPASWFGVD